MTIASQGTASFTQRQLAAVMTTWADHKERARQIEVTILALAAAYGLPDVRSVAAG
jgi:hypothetical protein